MERAEALVLRRTGLVFPESRHGALGSDLAHAMHRAHLSDPDIYLTRLAAEPALLDDLVAAITVGESYFFREPAQLDLIRDEIVPALRARRPPGRPLRIWSAGCADGQEPYTLAILLHQIGLAGQARIVATDISRPALARARRGRYTRWSFRGVPEGIVREYFQPHGKEFELSPAIRNAVEFRYLNLAQDVYPSLATGIWGIDLILCRNVLMYFGPETVARVARRLMDCLSDDGWLLLGASDPALSDLVSCDVVVTGAGLAYQRPGRGAASPPFPLSTQWRGGQEVRLPPLLEPVASVPPPPPPPPPVPPPAGEPAWVVAAEAPSHDPEDAARAYARRDYERAAELAGRLVQRDGSDPLLWIMMVRALANRGELEAAGRACAAALDRHRASAELTYLHAVLLSEAGLYPEAAAAARRALYLDRGLVVGHLALGSARARLGDVDGARRAFRNGERLLAAMPPGAVVPASDGEPAGRLVEMARVQLRLLSEVAA